MSKGEHCRHCGQNFPGCMCLTCANDMGDSDECCKSSGEDCPVLECKRYQPESEAPEQ